MFKELKFLSKVIEGNRTTALVLFILMLLSAASEAIGLGMIFPFLELIVDKEGVGTSVPFLKTILQKVPESNQLLFVGLLFAGFIFLKNFLFLAKTWLSSFFSYNFKKKWQSEILRKYMRADYGFIVSNREGVLLNNLIVEPSRGSKSLELMLNYFSMVILSMFLYGLLLTVNWKATLLLTLVSIAFIVPVRKITRRYSLGVGKKKIEFSQKLIAVGSENLQGVKQIKISSFEDASCTQFKEHLDNLHRMLIRFLVVRQIPKVFSELILVFGVVGTLLVMHYFLGFVLRDLIPLIGLYVVVIQRFMMIVSTLISGRINILTFIPSLKLAYQLYHSDIPEEKLEAGTPIHDLKEDIQFKNVYFEYPNSKGLFEDLSLTIPKGKVTAFVGSSGSGKTTVVELLLGFFRKQKGKILINNIDLDELSLASFRGMVGYVHQDPFLFNTTIRENIRLGKPSATDTEIIEAAKKAHADQFIGELPDGLDTFVGDRGVKISGGQKQRIAIARILLHDPQILIFDEATNALDSESEAFIQQSIEESSRDKTVIIISHRVSSLKYCDLVHVIENGKVVESGGFSELKSKKGRLYELGIN